jgi:hypothetical protein
MLSPHGCDTDYTSIIYDWIGTMNHLVIVYDGELSKDIAEQLMSKQRVSSFQMSLRSAGDKPKGIVSDYCQAATNTVVCFIIQTIENMSPTEDVSENTFCYGNDCPQNP